MQEISQSLDTEMVSSTRVSILKTRPRSRSGLRHVASRASRNIRVSPITACDEPLFEIKSLQLRSDLHPHCRCWLLNQSTCKELVQIGSIKRVGSQPLLHLIRFGPQTATGSRFPTSFPESVPGSRDLCVKSISLRRGERCSRLHQRNRRRCITLPAHIERVRTTRRFQSLLH